MLHQGLEVFTQVDTDAKRKFVSFNVIPSNGRVLCVYAPSECNTREQFDRKNFFEGLQNYVKKKSEGNENKIKLLNVNCNMDKQIVMVEIKQKDFLVVPIIPCKTHHG